MSTFKLALFKLTLVFVLIGIVSCEPKNNNSNKSEQSEKVKTEEYTLQPTHDDKDDAAFIVFEKQVLEGYKKKDTQF